MIILTGANCIKSVVTRSEERIGSSLKKIAAGGERGRWRERVGECLEE